jgi:hypothetical protein
MRDGHAQAPQGSNLLVGTLGIVVLVAMVTMFGIGMEVGLARVLTFGLSAASLVLRSVMLGGSQSPSRPVLIRPLMLGRVVLDLGDRCPWEGDSY